jgi:hypothetical protein
MNTVEHSITIERVGHTGRAFRIRRPILRTDGSWSTSKAKHVIDIRTRSWRRFLVVDIYTGSVEKRTDSWETAKRERNRTTRCMIIDTLAGEFAYESRGVFTTMPSYRVMAFESESERQERLRETLRTADVMILDTSTGTIRR